MSPNDELVLNAIRKGKRMSSTHLDAWQIRDAIKRLVAAGLIRRKNLGGYEAVNQVPPLTKVW